jgi:glycosyltransferase involved in cell wall biosynthesis
VPVRVVHIIPTLDRGGAEKQLTLLAAGLPRDEFEVQVCCLTRGGPLEADLAAAGIPVTILGKSWKIDPYALWKLYRFLVDAKPDIVQTWLFAANSYGRLAASWAGVKHIVGGERCVDEWKMWHEVMIDRWLAGSTETIVVNSPAISDFYTAKGIAADKFTVIPNGVPDPPPLTKTRDELLRELSLPANVQLIVCVNRLWQQKRVKDMIWCMDQLSTVAPDIHLLICGDGPQREQLERYTRLTENASRVHFLGVRDDVLQILPHCHALWLASEYEGLPNAILEAMAAGIPVIASDIPGNRDLVIDGETGLLFPVGHRATLSRQMLRILSDPDLGRQLAAAGRARVRRDFNVPLMIERFASLYRKLVSSN